MELLKQRILKDGKSLPGGILKVDSFINHQMDSKLMYKIAEEFVKRFKGYEFDKVVTIESSGIAPAIMTGLILDLPVIFIKKKRPSTMSKFKMFTTVVHSFTKNIDCDICISSEFLKKGDRVLFIDDFIANGNTAFGMLEIAKQANIDIKGMGFVIEKSFQNGGNKLRKLGYNVESLAIVDDLSDCKIVLH